MHFTPVPNIKTILCTAMHYGSRHGHTEDFVSVGDLITVIYDLRA